MKLHLLSDLHLEFADFTPQCTEADVIVLAGDIHLGVKALAWLDQFKLPQPIIYVLGNHEYYKHTYPKLLRQLKAQSPANLHILENETLELDGVVFHGVTLWTDFELLGNARLSGATCQQGMNDFRYIRREPTYSKMRSIDLAIIHSKTRRWLEASLKSHAGKTNIVVTHHAPSIQSLPERSHSDPLSPSYASNLESLIEQNSISYWLHGHIHRSVDYTIGSCRVLSNPRGYPDQPNSEFNPEFLIEINN